MKKISQANIVAFQKKILAWYKEHKRDLPWRRTRDPYSILVSEVMLQQTQVSRVIPKYEAWLKEFPDVTSLAKASTRDVLALWSGLGYNRRALNLKKSAEEVVSKGNGVFSSDIAELKKLPGIGEYTARAMLCFAFDEQIAVVDTNVRKVILLEIVGRHSGKREKRARLEDPHKGVESDSGVVISFLPRMTDKEIQNIADQILPKGKAYEWNQALMDYASAHLKKEKIPIPKQARFVGSNRYYRGKLLRLLLTTHSLPLAGLGEKLKDDFSEKDKAWLRELLRALEKERFISLSQETVKIASGSA